LGLTFGPQEDEPEVAVTLADNLRAEEREVEADPETLKDRDDRVQRAFVVWHRDHPEVYEALLKFVRRYKDIGVRKGMRYFFEVMRHEHIMSGRDAQGFKLNNNFCPRYARLIEREHEDLRGFFKKRRLKARGLR
jgi:hypothetical protein